MVEKELGIPNVFESSKRREYNMAGTRTSVLEEKEYFFDDDDEGVEDEVEVKEEDGKRMDCKIIFG